MMSKSKKRKTAHESGNSAPTHDQIWDDSFLQQSWDTAVKEYEYYHSLAAQGLDPDEVIEAAEAAEAEGTAIDLMLPESSERGQVDDDREDGEVEGEEIANETGEIGEGPANDLLALRKEAALQRAGLSTTTTCLAAGDLSTPTAQVNGTHKAKGIDGPHLHGPFLPATIDGTQPEGSRTQPQHRQQDQNQPLSAHNGQTGPQQQTLENLKMAYYWAGYYSGLYDAQRGAAATATDASPPDNGG